MANDFWSDLPQSTSSDFWADLDKQQAKQAPQRDEQELARLKAVREGRAKPTYTTPGQELQRSNRPLTKAREAFTQSMSEPTIGGVSAYWNPLRLLQAGAESAGEAVGTTAHNIASNIPGLGGPAGVVPAAIGALANTETQTLGLGTPKNILGAAKGIDKTLRSTGSLIKRALRTPIRESTIARVPESIAKLPPANYEALEKQLASTPDVADIFDRAAEVAENGPPGIRPSTKNLLKYY